MRQRWWEYYKTEEDCINNEFEGITKAVAKKYIKEHLPKEKYFQEKIMKHLKTKYPKAFCFKVSQGAYSQAGIPDICFIYKGHYFGFEVKRPFYGTPSKLQENTIAIIRDAEGTAGFVTYPYEAEEMIQEVLSHGKTNK